MNNHIDIDKINKSLNFIYDFFSNPKAYGFSTPPFLNKNIIKMSLLKQSVKYFLIQNKTIYYIEKDDKKIKINLNQLEMIDILVKTIIDTISALLTKPVLKDKVDECIICLDPIDNKIILPCCMSCYCNDCIIDWLDKSDTCPFCREPIDIEPTSVYEINLGGFYQDNINTTIVELYNELIKL